MPPFRVLLVDDDQALRRGLAGLLRAEGFQVTEAGCLAEALGVVGEADPDLALLDHQLPDGDSLGLLEGLRDGRPGLPVVVLTGHGTVDLAVQAIQAGADHFLTKPVDVDALLAIMRRALDGTRLRRLLASETRRRSAFNPFLGRAPGVRELGELARRVASTDLPVLIQGETGSGKGVLARWLHEQGARGSEPFVDLNCAALGETLLESELFGHERGAFTGAVVAKEGLMELAHRGTLFLDEVGDLAVDLQPKLLKAIEEGRFRRVGGTRERLVDLRLLTATHQDLSTSVTQRQFREDLYFRISSVVLRVPPLRERLEDLPDLLGAFLPEIARRMGHRELRVSAGALTCLQTHTWRGNLRELRNVLERAALFADKGLIEPVHLMLHPQGVEESAAGDLTLEAMERAHVARVLRLTAGDMTEAARRLGIARSTLYQKVKLWQSLETVTP